MFDDVLEETDGDGPWRAELAPPPAVEDSLAGYIWAGLASPEAAIRWEASHVVVALCELGRSCVLSGLFRHASANTSIPFIDRRFVFYVFHAQQWLSIATARAALEFGSALVQHVNQFLTSYSTSQPHVLIRLFLARTVLALADQGLIELQHDVRVRLGSANKSPFEIIKLDSLVGYSCNLDITEDEIPESDRYFFGIDFGPYWLVPLGRCFGITESTIVRETLKTIRQDFRYIGFHRRDEDERARRRLYSYEETIHSHGSSPRVDDHGFYQSYHAMLITAGRLLETMPLIERSDSWEEDSFSGWIARHDISRSDGRWLADRRDPQPMGRLPRLEEQSEGNWLPPISPENFEDVLNSETGYLTVWGYWSDLNTNRRESISVNTALVSKERSSSLLRALQTTEHPHDYRIPDALDELQIDEGPYQLKGWIVDRPGESGIDEYDPWAGRVRFPAPEPAAYVAEMMQLSTDSDRRLWFAPFSPVPALKSEVWGYYEERNDDEKPCGKKLYASIQFVVKLLVELGMDLVVKVEIQRRYRHEKYNNEDGNEHRNNQPSARIFIVKGDGTICAL